MSKKVLHIITSPQGEASVSKQLGNVIIEKIQAKYPNSFVKERDLAKESFPHLDGLQIGSWFTPAENHTPEQIKAIKISDEAIAEMREADIYVVGAPFYNFAITSTLKAYLDHIARPGITFSYKEDGMPEGLLKNKKAYIAIASSGVYSQGVMQSFDFVSPYLKFILGFLGITDITTFRVEGQRIPGLQETALQKGLESIVID
ncbi:FMN-dependent NADH-azoreductase [Dyadobacter endophyticus]|uniref:FMN dependent NADH:quinone oxidoreductase n=1 Tax=Dyadobacter endophyticus TaxID=1749036 RepID=A0ABQ1YE42_9BACT|nr:NAD(P)H-dependent oxidoreductase [Dyadobacter endophyticus]GGH21353.1 FMN-dependent NADH-azoreductase [Dyadobacter endophyticus]